MSQQVKYSPRGSSRASRALGALPGLPFMDGRSLRELLAYAHSLGKGINFFEAGSSPYGTWGEALLRDPLIASAVLLEGEKQEENRPALLERLLRQAGYGPEACGVAEPSSAAGAGGAAAGKSALLSLDEQTAVLIERTIRQELAWQNSWAERLSQAGMPCDHPLFKEWEEQTESGFSNSLPGFLERDFPGYAQLLRKLRRQSQGASDFGLQDVYRAGDQTGNQAADQADQQFGNQAIPKSDQAEFLRQALASLKELALLLALRRAALLEHAGTVWRELAANPQGRLSPHTGMLLSFLRLYANLQKDQNALPAAHADYFYRRLLGFVPAPARADRALVTFTPEAGAPFFSLPAGTQLLADNPDPPEAGVVNEPDESGGAGAPDGVDGQEAALAELEFRTLEATPVNPAALTEILAITPPIGESGPLPGPWCRVGDYSAVFGAQVETPSAAVHDLWAQTAAAGELRVCPTLLSMPDFELGGGERRLEIRISLSQSAKNALSGADNHALRQAWQALQSARGSQITQDGAKLRAPLWFKAEFSTAEGWAAPIVCQSELRFGKGPGEQEHRPELSATAGASLPELLAGSAEGDHAEHHAAEYHAAEAYGDHSSFRLPENALPLQVFDFDGLSDQPVCENGENGFAASSTESAAASAISGSSDVELVLRLRLESAQPALSAAQTEIHGFCSVWPVLRLSPNIEFLNSDGAAQGWQGNPPDQPEPPHLSNLPYLPDLTNMANQPDQTGLLIRHVQPAPEAFSAFWRALSDFRVSSVKVGVNVRGLRDFLAGSSGGLVPNPRDAGFEPFGGSPELSDAFILEVPELKGKRATRLRVRWNWNAPRSFAEYFKAYPFAPILLTPSWRAEGGEWNEIPGSPDVDMTGRDLRYLDCVFDYHGLNGTLDGDKSGILGGDRAGVTGVRWRIASGGSLFGHRDYPALQAKAALNESTLLRRGVTFLMRGLTLRKLNPPYAPLWHDLAVDYDALSCYGHSAISALLVHAHPFNLPMDMGGPESAAQTSAQYSSRFFAQFSGQLCKAAPEGVPGGQAAAQMQTPCGPRLFAHYGSYSLGLGFNVPELTLAHEQATRGAQCCASSPLSLYFRLQNKSCHSFGLACEAGPELAGGTILKDDTSGLNHSGLIKIMPGEPDCNAAQASDLPAAPMSKHDAPLAVSFDAPHAKIPPCPPKHCAMGAVFLPFSEADAPHFRLRLDWPCAQGAPDFALQGVHANAVWAEWAMPAGPTGTTGPAAATQSGAAAGALSAALPDALAGARSVGASSAACLRVFPLPPDSLNRLAPRAHRPDSASGGHLARYLDSLQISQPYASVGGRAAVALSGGAAWQTAGTPATAQTALAAFWQDSAESLSHREQAVLPRDYERIALRDYPEIMSAVCLPHCAGNPQQVAPGQVSLAVFAPQEGAKIWRENAKSNTAFTLNPALPAYADFALLERLAADLRGRSSPFATLHVLQAHYQPLSLRLAAFCDPWMNVGQAAEEAREVVERLIAPWAFEPGAAAFGQSLRLDLLLERIRELSWLTGLAEFRLADGAPPVGESAGNATGSKAGVDARSGIDLLAELQNLDDAARRLDPATPYSFFYPQRLEIEIRPGGSK